MEYIWSLESRMDGQKMEWEELKLVDKDNRMVHDPDTWFMNHVSYRAAYLWQGEQVDGSIFEWGSRHEELGELDAFEEPGAVMAGYRYLTSLKSTPKRMRAPMHCSLFNKGLYM